MSETKPPVRTFVTESYFLPSKQPRGHVSTMSRLCHSFQTHISDMKRSMKAMSTVVGYQDKNRAGCNVIGLAQALD